MNGNDTDYVTLTGAADAANIPASTLRRWIESGRLPATTGDRGRLVRLADVWRLVEAPERTPEGTAERAAMGTTERAPDHIRSLPDIAEETAPLVPVSPPARVRRQRAIAAATAAYMAKLDELYRAQITAQNGELATKDELIVELRRRAEFAEREAMALGQRLAEAHETHEAHEAHEAHETPTTRASAQPPATPLAALVLLLRLLHLYRQR